MKGSDLLVKCLENEGVEYVFGIPGEETLDLMESLSKSSINFILTRHEQGAAFMANVYGRLAGKPGVCLATLGPGATNLITGVADAQLDRAPLVAITGQAPLEAIHKESHQYIDVVQTFKFITKWNRTITKASFIPEMVRKAFKIAMVTPGATHLELPEDVAQEECDGRPLAKEKVYRRIEPDEEAVHEAAELIRVSSYPVILAGNGVIRASASEELLEFARENEIPVVNTFMGKGAISAREELYLGTIGLQSRDYVECGLERADLVISVGYDLVEYAPKLWNPGEKTIIHIDTKTAEIDEHYQPKLELVGNIGATLRILTGHTGFKKGVDYSKKLRNFMIDELERFRDDTSFPLKPQRVVSDIRRVLRDDDILVCDVGAHKLWIARLYPAYSPNTVIISNGFASMGIALPGAIAAKLVHPGKHVVAAMGDGGFLMNEQELETAIRLGLGFVVVIFNDSKYGMIEWNQFNRSKESYGVEFTNPDFVKLAESYGAIGVRLEEGDSLTGIIEEGVASNELWVIDVPVDYSENIKLSQKLGQNVCQF
jgi:acetolactate synthase-1/2/3 large subunit